MRYTQYQREKLLNPHLEAKSKTRANLTDITEFGFVTVSFSVFADHSFRISKHCFRSSSTDDIILLSDPRRNIWYAVVAD